MAKVPNVPFNTSCTRALLITVSHVYREWLHIIERRSYQIACHMLTEYQIELAYAKHCAYAHSSRLPLVIRPNEALTDRRQYTQAAGTRSMISRCLKEQTRSC